MSQTGQMSQTSGAIKVTTVRMPQHLRRIHLVPFADWQVGEPGFQADVVDGYVRWIREREHAYILLNGDIVSMPARWNRARDVYDRRGVPAEDQIATAVEHLRPVKDRILAATDGNHESGIYSNTGTRPTLDLLRLLGVPDVAYDPKSVLVRIEFGPADLATPSLTSFTYLIYMTHGWGGSRKTGAHVNKAEELAQVVDADVYVVAHEHTLYYSRIRHFYLPEGAMAVQVKRRTFTGCGSGTEYTDYQREIGRMAPDSGFPRIRLEGPGGTKGHKDVHISY